MAECLPGTFGREGAGCAQDVVAAAPATRLDLDAVSVRYGEVRVLDEVTLALDLRSRTVVIGANGAGKSTLLQAIQGLVPLAGGTVVGSAADGTPRRPHFGFVFQKPVMLRRSARANIEHAVAVAERRRPWSPALTGWGGRARQRRRRALEALEAVGLADLAERGARHLSGGEQQRLAIARANALGPECLLLDEPTSHLDPGASTAIERLLLRISMAGVGLVMTTHDLGQARRLAQTIVFLHRGRVLEVSPAEAFFKTPASTVARRFVAGEWLED